MLRGLLVVVIILVGFTLCFSVTPSDLVKEGKYDEAIEAYRKAIDASKDDKEKAYLHKELGEVFALREDFQNAAEEHIQALSLYREGFSENERLQMAIHISWGNRLKEAIQELSLILKENPDHIDARIQLARCLSWVGEWDRAKEEADHVLEASPENKDALLVKANVFRWENDPQRAIPIYESILEKGEDFDTRLGLTYALLAKGDIKRAKESSKLLKPAYRYQERELKKLLEDLSQATRPAVGMDYSYYHDSDDNQLNRFSIFGTLWLDNWKMDLNYKHTEAKDPTRHNRDEDLSLRIYSKVTESFGIGGGLGVNQVDHSKTHNYLTGNIRGDMNLLNGIVGVSVARYVFADTAQLIENRIRVTNPSLYVIQNLTDRLSLYGSYNYKDYSDRNYSNDFQVVPRYTVYTGNPRIAVGYRFRYLDFDRQSNSGYFDPNHFVSHEILPSLFFEGKKFFVFVEPYIGYQSFKRNGVKSNDIIGGGSGKISYRIGERFALEVAAEGGNYALSTAAGFNYYQISSKLFFFF
jgi:tetratricopeptide (TPR) repeat protein